MWRHFSSETEALADRWATMTMTPDHWEVGDLIANTQTQPRHVQSGHVAGVGKPMVILGDGKSRAAHERIAFELGYRLGLPVLPVLLWDRSGIAGAEPHACVMAWAFKPVSPLNIGVAALAVAERSAIAPEMSALIAFDFWLADTDRKSDHVVITKAPGRHPAIATLDYSNSMSHVWDCDNHPATSSDWFRNEWGGLGIPFDAAAFDQSLTAIENFPDEQIRDIVGNVPSAFLPNDPKRFIISNLTSRKSHLRQMIKI